MTQEAIYEDPTEEALYWLAMGTRPTGMIYCTDCNAPHAKNKCQRND
jgi:hypothetical protein